jgi:hypothetical protein
MPPGGVTCLPTCDETDAKMFVLAGSNQASMSNTPINVWIMVPGDQASFTLGIFDGDTGKAMDNTLQFWPNGKIITLPQDGAYKLIRLIHCMPPTCRWFRADGIVSGWVTIDAQQCLGNDINNDARQPTDITIIVWGHGLWKVEADVL